MKSIGLPKRLEYIGYRCFKSSALSSFAVPAMLNNVDGLSFAECKNLKRVEFLEGRVALGTVDAGVWNAIFRECGVEEILLPSTLYEIGPNLFVNCDSLRTIRVAKGCKVQVKQLVGEDVKVRNM